MATSRPDTLKAHWKCMVACTLVSMCPFQYGVDFGIIGGLQAMPGFLEVFGHKVPTSVSPIGYNIDHTRQQLISSLMILGAFISSSTAGPIAKFLGRKMSIWIAALLCVVANIVMMVTTSIGALYFARFLIGIANGMLMTFSQLYLQECAPAKYRGLVIGLFQSWTSIGTLVGTVIDNFTVKLDGKNQYIVSLAIIYIVPVFLSIGLLFIPESPRWYLLQGKTEKARKALNWLRPYPDTVDDEVTQITEAIEAEHALAKSAAVLDMIRNPVDRRRTLLAVGAVSLQAASGAMYMISYGTYFFEMAKVGSAFENSCILVAVGVVAILINSAVITRWGRRRVFLTVGMCLCGITQLIVAIVYDKQGASTSTGKVIVGVSVVYIVGYNGMVATYAWLCGGEFPSQRLRSYTFGLAASIGFLGAWLATFTAPYFINPDSLNWGPKYGYIWFPSCLLGALWTWLYLPEVQNRTFEEIDEMFEARLPARKFRTYRCVGSVAAVAMAAKEDGSEGSEKEHEHGNVTHREVILGNEKAAVETAVAIG
ncbi:general alpha-glucoside permease [Cladophialophora carrionii]|uniref:General alpha-glucoside permease n=1 Tax=Cladophialophora carrionii TaxID=86049 RepID=A0A1C1CNK2_9EURO|nr:general alpha-glucoside permease [Cladophialophora carrionii]